MSLIILLSLLATYATAQCTFESDFSSSSGWTQVGSGVSINNGNLEFVNASGGQQRRVYQSLATPLTGNDTWRIELDFTPTALGTWSGQPAAGHYLVALSTGTNDPLTDCPNVACSGYPAGTQDGVMVNFLNPVPPDGNVNFQILHKQGSTELTSGVIPFLGNNTTYYVTFERLGPNDYQLSVFSNGGRTNHLPGSPVALNVPGAVTGLSTIHHGVITRGNSLREMSGSIGGVCVTANPPIVIKELPAFPKTYLVLFGVLMMGAIGFLLRKQF